VATYAEAGVDIVAENATIATLTAALSRTFSHRDGKLGEVLPAEGHFANYVRIGKQLAVLCTDGVGTKVLVAQQLRKYDTVGIDCVAMNVNDMLCVGAEPIAMVDYLAVERHDPEMVRGIAAGLAEGARQAGIAIIGGETASLAGVITGVEGRGFDLAGTCFGLVDESAVITGSAAREGDAIVGLASSGIHANGLSLARKILLGHADARDALYPGMSIGDALLEPTRIYVKPVLEMLRTHRESIHAMYHITGSGFLKFRRLRKDIGFRITTLLPVPRIFQEIEKRGVPAEEMFRTFNMGVGFVLVTPEPEPLLAIARRHGVPAGVIGEVDGSRRITIEPAGVSYEVSHG